MASVENAKENGKKCAFSGMNKSGNPYRNHPISKEHSDLHQAWEDGWVEGHKELNEE